MRTIVAVWLGLGLLVSILGIGDLGVPGPYYDEVIQALPSVEFLEGRARVPAPPGSEVITLFGRPFPWMTQTHMGALKSQLLIPSFAAAGSSLSVLRLTTLAWSILGLLVCVAFARRAFGSAVAFVAGLLLACDPSFLFMSRHDWGSFSLGFLLRCAALLFAVVWWQSGRLRHALLAGSCLGLGIYNKVDFVLFPAAATLALLAVDRERLWRVLRERRTHVLGAIATATLVALPILSALPELGEAAGRLAERVSLSEKILALGSVLDGSYLLRLIRVGGRFNAMFSVEDVPRGGLGVAALLMAAGLAFAALRRRAPPGTSLLLACGISLAVLHLLLPGGARAHHLMNLYPFPHLVVALGLVALWQGRRPPPAHSTRAMAVRRAAVGILLLAVLVTNLRVIGKTHAEIQQSGGRGYWSDAVVGFVKELSASPGARVVCLDWGLHNQVAFLGDELRSLDAIWPLLRARPRGRIWSFVGDARDVYLIHPEHLDLFGFGPRFQRALEVLPPDRVEVRPQLDREGGVAFLAVRLEASHRIRYDGRSFVIRLE